MNETTWNMAGDAPSFSNWDEDQPDDHLGYQQDCASIDAKTGRWRDVVCVPLDPLALDELSCLCSRGDASAAFADELKELEATRAYNQRLLKFHSDSCER